MVVSLRQQSKPLFSFKFQKFKHEVLYKVVPMNACNLLFGRPWQFDGRVIHSGLKNTYSFTLKMKR